MSIRNLTAKVYYMILTIMLLGPANAFAAYDQLNMPESVTELGAEIYNLHMIVFWIVTIAGIVVFAIMIYSIIYHRKSKGAVAEQFHESTTVEIIWTTIPLIILIIIAIPATSTLLKYEDTTNADLTITATAYQWKWQYNYNDENINFFSSLSEESNKARQLGAKVDLTTVDGGNYLLSVDNPVVVPVNKKIRILTTSKDVIHAWWIPDLAVKRDAIPGFINESWFKAEKVGTYRGQCAELCGVDHGFMPIVVNVVSDADYATWVSEQQAAGAAAAANSNKTYEMAELMKIGEKAYNTSCGGCHQANGAGMPPTFPALAGSKLATGPVKEHLDMVMNGSKKNPMMAAYAAQLDDLSIAAIVTYERNAWGNNTGDLVQPSDIKAAR